MSVDQKDLVTERRAGLNVMTLAQDAQYISDLTDEELSNLYKLAHIDFGKNFRKNADPSNIEGLKAETIMRQEFSLRGITPPELEDKLNEVFQKIFADVKKEMPLDEPTGIDGETSPDALDQHIHKVANLSPDGHGATSEAGTPPHTHNVHEFQVMPVEIDGYKSDHPGKINLKVGKSSFQVTKRHDNGDMEWEASFDIFKLHEEQHLVAGIVYEPDVIDAQGDSASESEILKACHNYMVKSMTLGKMHEQRVSRAESVIVENYIAPTSFHLGGQFVRKGSWIQVHKVMDEDLWKEIKGGKYTGFSMAGRAKDVSKTPAFDKAAKTKPKIKNVWLSLKQVEKVCPNCAKIMRKKKIAKIRIDTLLNSAKFQSQFGEGSSSVGYKGLCRKFGTNPLGFISRCEDVMQDTDMDDPKSFCTQLKDLCLGLNPNSVFMEDVLDIAIEDQNTTLVDGNVGPVRKSRLSLLATVLAKGFDMAKVLREEEGKYCVYSQDGSQKLGCHDSKEEALSQLAAIEANKVEKKEAPKSKPKAKGKGK